MPFVKASVKHIGYRFWSRVDKRGEDECWPWLGKPGSDGYGRLKQNGKSIGAHVHSFELHTGLSADGLCVCHRCDNPLCVNPNHLFRGNNIANIADRTLKGRSARGDRNGSRVHPESRPRGEGHHWQTKPWTRMHGQKNGRAKLTDEQVSEVKRLHGAGEKVASIARKFGVSWTAIKYIVIGRNWSMA